jgi:hypothetical protein
LASTYTLASALKKKALFIVGAFCLCFSFKAYCFESSNSFHGGEETILVDGSHNAKLSYSQSIKNFSKQIFRSYLGALFFNGEACSSSMIRNFNDLAERTRYGFNLEQERVELKLTLDF